jgi:hypothetical protein
MSKELTTEEKAARWDALMGCERISVLGYARGGPKGQDGNIQHLGVDMWVKHPTPHDEEDIISFHEFVEGMLPKE